MNKYYLKSEAERIIRDLRYECDEHDIETVAEMFDENYNSFFSPFLFCCPHYTAQPEIIQGDKCHVL